MSEIMQAFVDEIMKLCPEGINVYVTFKQEAEGVGTLIVELSEMERGKRKTGR